MQRILITGGAGFVGTTLGLGLKQRWPEAHLVALDNLKRRGSELNIARLRDSGIAYVHGDVRSTDDIESAGAFDVLLECSAEPSVLAGYDGAPRYLVDTNLMGTVNCLDVARKHNASIVFLSTSRVYPHDRLNALPFNETATRLVWSDAQFAQGISEDFPLEGTRSLYGATKLCSELILCEYCDMYGLRGVVNRCGVLAGPWQMGKIDQGVAVLWAARHLYGGKLSYIGYGGLGKQVRDMLHVDDLLDLIIYQLENMDTLKGQTFNVGGGLDNSVSLQELTVLCAELTGNTIPITSDPVNRPADIPIYITDNTRITQTTGWKPQRDTRQLMTEIVAWLRENEKVLRPLLT